MMGVFARLPTVVPLACENGTMPKSGVSEDTREPGLAHVVVSGGTPAEWMAMSSADWTVRLASLAAGAAAAGARWVTLLPHHGDDMGPEDRHSFTSTLDETGKVATVEYGSGLRHAWRTDSGMTVIVDPVADGHARFAAVVEAMRVAGVAPESLDEDLLSAALLAPASEEPDLVIVLGPPGRIPTSMVWELAYSELVFLDLSWGELNSTHVELAIDDFNRRHRRFGGLDS